MYRIYREIFMKFVLSIKYYLNLTQIRRNIKQGDLIYKVIGCSFIPR